MSIPERERPVWDDPALAQRIVDGIEQANRSETYNLGDVRRYLDGDGGNGSSTLTVIADR